MIEIGVVLIAARACCWRTWSREPWQLYADARPAGRRRQPTAGLYGQSLFLPNWFVRRRGLAIGIAFSGVGVGAIVLLPWLQTMIVSDGWRTACWPRAARARAAGAAQPAGRQRPEDIGLPPDGEPPRQRRGASAPSNIVDPAWAAIDWTLRARHAHRPLLVDRARLFLRAVRLVRGAGAPDEIPDRDRLHADVAALGAGARQPGRRSPGRSRSAICPTGSAANGSGRSAMLGLRDLLPGAARCCRARRRLRCSM